jgi:Tol biopolymer transport system component
MTLDAGTTIGAFEITEQIGAGGMGEVWRARDTNLKRDVAIKALPESFAADADRLARFQREAEMLASLNHPNIATIHGLEKSDNRTLIVMELVEGPTLADRIAEGPIPPDEALGIAQQIADALEAAHGRQIVHRDLKPANIKLRDDGTVKVLDFGISKPIDASAISGGAAVATTPAVTETGVILGTAAYMSPEQARGKFVDERTDIWAFGCLLFEMLTGQPAFGGEDVMATLARVIDRDTDLSSMPGTISPAVRQTIRLCLEKDPKRRIADIRDVRLSLAGDFEPEYARASDAGGNHWRLALPFGVATAVIAGLAVFLIMRGNSATEDLPQSVAEVVRFSVALGEADGSGAPIRLGGEQDARWGRPSSTSLALSNDGRRVVYAGWTGSAQDPESLLYIRSWDQERAAPIAGTEDASSPFFSPDDAWIGFFAGGALRRVSTTGGNLETIVVDAQLSGSGASGATWGDDGTIVYGRRDGLYRVVASGGEAELVAAPSRESPRFAQPYYLPGSGALLFHTVAANLDPEQAEIWVLDLATGEQRNLLGNATDARYNAETGRLFFIRQGTLMAAGFDPVRLKLEGQPVVVLEDVMQAFGMPNANWETGTAQVALSRSGHLAYAPGGVYPGRPGVISLITADGTLTPLVTDRLEYGAVRVAPDGDRLVFENRIGRSSSLHIHDLERGITRRLNTGGFLARSASWSPDGTSIAFSSDREDGRVNIYRMDADGSGEPERLVPSDRLQLMSSWSVDGVIAYVESTEAGDYDIWVLPPDGDPVSFVGSDADEVYASFSPNGRWMVYGSDESGRSEVYVRPYPGPGPATLISGNGGVSPAWSSDGAQIYYLERDVNRTQARMMVVDVVPESPFRAGRPRVFLDPWPTTDTTVLRAYDVLGDGQFVLPMRDDGVDGNELRTRFAVGEFQVVLNFLEAFRQRVGE